MQAMSCTGPLIVDDCGSTPYDYDDERILLFQDHFKKSDDDMIHGLTSSAKFAWTGETSGLLLNGKGVATGHTAAWCPAAEANGYFGSRRFTWASVSDDNDDSGDHEMGYDSQIQPSADCTLPVIDVEPGKTYRFRFIGSTSLSVVAMGFEDHHDLTIVQVDGSEYNAPVPVNHIQLAGGQRFDVLFRTKTTEELHASGNREFYFLQFETRDRPETYRGYAVLRYNPNADIPPAPPQPVVNLPTEMAGWMEYTFQPLDPDQSRAPTSDEVTRRVILTAQQKLDKATGRVVFQLSQMPWVDAEHQKPVLVDIYERGHAAIPDYIAAILNGGWDPKTKFFPALVDEVLEIVIQNTGSLLEEAHGVVESHPFHAHGQHYYDVGSGPGLYDAETNNAKLAEMDYKPIKRDTTLLFRYPPGKVEPGAPAGWRAWRMRVDNPGVWMMHCHILAHMIMGEFCFCGKLWRRLTRVLTGMQSIWVVGDADDIISMPLTVSQQYLTYGGSVYGNATHDPEMVHFFDDAEEQCPAVVVVEPDC